MQQSGNFRKKRSSTLGKVITTTGTGTPARFHIPNELDLSSNKEADIIVEVGASHSFSYQLSQ